MLVANYLTASASYFVNSISSACIYDNFYKALLALCLDLLLNDAKAIRENPYNFIKRFP